MFSVGGPYIQLWSALSESGTESCRMIWSICLGEDSWFCRTAQVGLSTKDCDRCSLDIVIGAGLRLSLLTAGETFSFGVAVVQRIFLLAGRMTPTPGRWENPSLHPYLEKKQSKGHRKKVRMTEQGIQECP